MRGADRKHTDKAPYEPLDIDEKPAERKCPKILIAFIVLYVIILIVFIVIAILMRRQSSRPHVIFIIADDLGWNDVSWRDPDMRTPTLAALLNNGVLLNYSYAHPFDGPSRAAIFTGMYPYHMGLQHEKFQADTPAFVPSNFTFLPQYLKNLGYKTHVVGKWHLGFCNSRFTPLARGFDSFFGYYTDDLDYFTHKDKDGYDDFRHNENIAHYIDGYYSTRLLAGWAENIVLGHDVGIPLFLALSFQAIHTPLQAPQKYLNGSCGHISDPARQTVCAMVAAMDEGIHNVTEALRGKGMLDDSVIIFTSDNGGVTGQGSSNSPLRGGNGELYDGGTRVTTLLSSIDWLSKVNYTFDGLFHQVDWVPTIVSMAGGDPSWLIRDTDGFDQWHAIRLGGPGPRTELVYNIDDVGNNHFQNGAIRVGDLKLVNGPTDFSHHTHNENNTGVQLYDLSVDPEEKSNLAESSPGKVQELMARLQELRKSIVPAADPQPVAAASPANFDDVWSPGWC